MELKKDVIQKKEEVTLLLSESIQQLQEKKQYADKLDKVWKKVRDDDLNEVVAKLKSKRLEDLRELTLKENLRELGSEFLIKLRKLHPNLRKNEVETCLMIYLRFSSNKICRLKAISPLTLKSSRYRIRKKMNLPRNVTLKAYLNGSEV